MRIRPARPEDAEAIAGVHVRAWQAAYAGVLPHEALAALSIEDRADRWRSWLREAPGLLVWVGEEDDGRVVGFASAGPSRDPEAAPGTAEVYTIYVEPDVVATGRGRELFAHAVDHIRTDGSTSAELWVLSANDRARRFYERAGWRTDGEERVESMYEMELRETRYRIEL